MSVRRTTRFWFAAAVVVGASACSVYDASLLDPAPPAGSAGLDPGGTAGSVGEDAASGSAGVGAAASGGAASGGSAAGGESGTGATGGGGNGGATASGGVAGGACTPRQPEARVFGAPDGGAIALRAAVSEVDFGDDPEKSNGVRHRELGYDLDGLCGATDMASCPAPAWPIRFETERPNGIDNSAGSLFERLADGLSGLSSLEVSARIRAGRGTMFLRIDGYNGTADDAVVAVSLVRTLPHVQPAWRGTDLWVLADQDHEGTPERPKQLDARGYVARGVMVARFASLSFHLPNPADVPLQIVLSRVVVTCRIEPNQAVQPFQARGCVLSGAWHHKDALRALQAYPVPEPEAAARPLCPGEPAYAGLRGLLCERVDLTAVGGSTNPCDAISFALRFETVAAFFDSQALGVLPEAPPRCSDPAPEGC
jgi:hypothetical protein